MMSNEHRPYVPELFAFIEAMEARVEEAKDIALPWLEAGETERPWSVARLEGLRSEAAELGPDVAEALETLWRYEVPLLAYEERLDAADVDFDEFAGRMHRFEQRFWRERHREAETTGAFRRSPAQESPVCKHHRVFAAEIRRLARDGGCWDVDAIARATGATTTCGSCRLEVTRILINELTKAKAAGAVA